MTSPEHEQPETTAEEAATIAVVAGALTAAGSVGATYGAAEVARETIVHALKALGIPLRSARRLMEIDAARPAPPVIPLSPSTRSVAKDGPTYRAQYLVNAAKRVAAKAKPAGGTVTDLVAVGTALADAVAKEKKYFHQHQTAQTAREQAAMRVDAAANAYGQLVGWYSILDDRTTPECVAADGRNFYPAIPPKIGLPGLKHYGNCRCRPGPPHANAQLVDPDAVPQPETIAAAHEGSPMALELASDTKDLPGGQKLTKSGQVYDPKTRTFRPGTEQDQQAAKDFNAKHPRAPKGADGGTGGQFVPLGQARSDQAATAQKDQRAVDAYNKIGALPVGQQAGVLKALNNGDLQRLSGVAYSFKSSDPRLVALRISVANELAKRGMSASDFGALGPAKAKPKAPAGLPSAGRGGVLVGDASGAQIDALRKAGWKGDPNDNREALYPPGTPVTKKPTGRYFAREDEGIELSAKTAAYSTSSTPLGKPGGPGLWGHPGLHLPDYIRNVAKGIMRSGATKSKAIEIAIGKIRDWAEGKGNVSPEVRAAAAKAMAEWQAARAKARTLASDTDGVELSWREHLHPRIKLGDHGGGRFTVKRGGLGRVPKGATRSYEGRGMTKIAAGQGGARKAAQVRAGTKTYVGTEHQITRSGLGGRTGKAETGGHKYTPEQLASAALDQAAASGQPFEKKADHLARLMGLDLSPDDLAKARKVFDKGAKKRGEAAGSHALLAHLKELAAKRKATPKAAAALRTGSAGTGKQTRIAPRPARQLAADEHTERIVELATALMASAERVTRGKGRSTAALELAAINGHHVPGTAYNWWHGWKPRNVATALIWGKKTHAAQLHKSGAPHAAGEPSWWWKQNPHLPKTIPANRKMLGGLTATGAPQPHATGLPKGATPMAVKAFNAPDVKPFQKDGKSIQAFALQKAVKTGKPVFMHKTDAEQLVMSDTLPAGKGKVLEFKPDGKVDAHLANGKTLPVVDDLAQLGPLFEAKAPKAPRAPKPDVAERLKAPIVDYTKIKDVALDEPPLPTGKGKVSTGIMVREPDGRIWIYEPKGGFGGYKNTFPKGKLEPDLTPQQNAHKELAEETGLTAKITKYVGDYQGTTGITRMYLAERTGGTPHKPDATPYVKGGSETAAVKLVTPDEAAKLLNTPRDQKILADALDAATGKPSTPAKTDRFTAVDTASWKKVGGKQGSNEGGTYLDPAGNGHYVKVGKTPDHVRNELLATELYHLAGVDSADLRLATVDGKPGTTSAWIPGAQSDFYSKLKTGANYKAKVQEGFAVDAWLANWDVAGLEFDNVVTDKAGNPVRVDPGGSLMFRAQGAPKGDAFGNVAGEWDTLRSGPQSGQVFGDMTDAQLKASAQKVLAISPAQISAAVDKAGFDPATASMLKTRLQARRANIAARAGLALPEQSLPKAKAVPDVATAPPRTMTVPTPGKRSKKGALVVQAPSGQHKVGDTIQVTSPAGNVHEVQVTGVGKEFNVKGVPNQYHYVKSVPKAAPKTEHAYTGTYQTLTGAKVAATAQAFKTGKPAYLRGDSGTGEFQVSSTKPPADAWYGTHLPDGTTTHHAGRKAEPKGLVNGSGDKPEPYIVSMIGETAKSGNKPVYLVEDPSTPSGFKIAYTKPADGTPHLAASPQGHVSEVASDGASTMIKGPAKVAAADPKNVRGVAALKAMPDIAVDPYDGLSVHVGGMQKAIKTGKTQYVIGPSSSAMITDQKPISGIYRRYEPNGDVYKGNASLGSPEQKLHPMAGDYVHTAKDQHMVPSAVTPISSVPFHDQAEAEKSAQWLAKHGGGKSYWVATAPDGKIYNYNQDPNLPGQKKFDAPSKEPALNSAEASSVISAKAAAQHWQKPAYISADGMLLSEPNGPIPASIQVDPDGTITKVPPSATVPSWMADAAAEIAHMKEPKAPAKPKLKNPPTKAAKGLGPTNKALYNAPDIQNNGNINIAKAAAVQQAIKTGQPKFLNTYAGKNEITDYPPDSYGYTSYSPDGTAVENSYGSKYTLKPSQVKASALIGLKHVDSEPTASTGTSGVTVKPIKPEQLTAFQGTTAGEFLAGHGKVIGETAAGEDFKKKANLASSEHDAVYSYTGSSATPLNAKLRKGQTLDAYDQKMVDGIDGAMAKYVTPETIIVKRGIDAYGFPSENLAGEVYQDAGYGSTSFGQGFTGSASIVWNIVVPKGSHGVPISGIGGGMHSHEKEFLLPRGTQYMIEKDEMVGSQRQITAVVIPTPVHSPTKITPAVKKHGVVHRAREKLAPGAYGKEGLLYLHKYGRQQWLRRYARPGALVGAG